jgi:pimeloyl-ACP methyl ester carboxylesterase
MKRLIVFVPAIFTRTNRYSELLGRLKDEPELAGSDWLLWEHGIAFWSRRSLIDAAVELCARVEQEWVQEGAYDEVILVGHSLGGILVRQAYLLAHGDYPEKPNVSPWGAAVRRIILLASVNRGFNPSNRLWLRLVYNALLVPFKPFFTVMRELLVGSNFITQLRIRWIKVFSQLGEGAPLVVQMLGTRDGMVRREDSIDLEQFPNAYQIDVPGANHGNLSDLRGDDPEGRYALYRSAFFDAAPPVPKRETPPKDIVVFVLHGIRASNAGWVEQVRSRILDRAPSAEVVTASYGYFSALNFALWFLRRRNISWFQDMYSYYLARYPRADFHFIGHSNGTYILGQSLAAVPDIRFNRVVLAGSVLPREYDWNSRFDRQQVRALRNDRASRDVPVAILCSGLRGLCARDIGTGGFDGFDDARAEEVFYYRGGHSEALQETNLDNIVDFILTPGASRRPPQLISEAEVSTSFRFLSRFAPGALIFVLLCAALAVGAAVYGGLIDLEMLVGLFTVPNLIFAGLFLLLGIFVAKAL